MDRRHPEQAERVLDATLACIARVGLAKTTLDDVARQANCARATVYRYFPGKQPLLAAVVDREVDTMQRELLAAAADAETLPDAVTAVVVTGARALQRHEALAFVAAYEAEQLLPFLAFERENAVLRSAAALVAPAFEPFLAPVECERLGEWLARITLSYFCSPSEQVDITDPTDVRALVEDFVLPGFVRPVMIRGGSQ
jgi:AcrR family transcriptional regulator